MSDFLKIYIDRLLQQEMEQIEETVSPQSLSLNEKDLQFVAPITLSGKAFLANFYLIIQLKIETVAEIPCIICNSPVQTPLFIPSFYQTEHVDGIKGRIYHYAESIREAILLEVLFYVECMGRCPKRTELKNYLKEKKLQFPFADLK